MRKADRGPTYSLPVYFNDRVGNYFNAVAAMGTKTRS